MSNMKTNAVVERFEGKWALLEVSGSGTFQFPRNLLPADVSEGSVLKIDIALDPDAEAEKRTNVRNLHQQLMDQS